MGRKRKARVSRDGDGSGEEEQEPAPAAVESKSLYEPPVVPLTPEEVEVEVEMAGTGDDDKEEEEEEEEEEYVSDPDDVPIPEMRRREASGDRFQEESRGRRRLEVIDLLLLRFVHLLVAFLACPGILVHGMAGFAVGLAAMICFVLNYQLTKTVTNV
uniref:Uncharacterized protein n=1 Tax=Oryza barthii TaxID=65489 RepID=A0A0D3HL39_9ORYZ